MGVFLLLAVIWAVVLVPPVIRANEARQEAFLASLGSSGTSEARRAAVLQHERVQRRRRIAGGLLVAMAVTFLVGLLPTFRGLLFVHLFLVDSFIAYIAVLAHGANRAARAAAPVEAEVEVEVEEPTAPAPADPARRRWWARERSVLPDLAPLG